MIGSGLYFGLIGSIKSIYKHKQRSFALIAGMILGAGILGGIFIYTDILNEANFNSIVEGTAYEVRFDNLYYDESNTDSLDNVLNDLNDHPLVDDAIKIWGESRQKTDRTSNSFRTYTSFLNVEFEDSNQGELGNHFENGIFDSNALIISENDMTSNIASKIENNVIEGSFSFSNRGVIIPQGLAEDNNLRVGDTTNISLYIYSGTVNQKRTYYNLTDVSINGITKSVGTGGSFLQNIFSQSKIYFSQELLFNEHPALQSIMQEELMNFIAVKVDPTQLTLSDSAIASSQIDSFINEIEKKYDGEIKGSNTISASLLGTQIFSIFIVLFDLFLILPVFILGIYLISFGAQLALNDRKKEIAILKIQGASPKQILRSILGEFIVLIVIGSIGAYIVSVLVGLSNSIAVGYMKFDFGDNFSKLSDALGYLKFNQTAFLIIVILGGGLLLYVGYNRSKGFIEAEVASVISKKTEKEESVIYRQKIDLIIFGIGLIALTKDVLNRYILVEGQRLDFGIFGLLLIDIPGPIFFWLGGALFISRLARIIPARIDKYILKLKSLNDVRIMIFADLRRRSVNTSRIALIIALAISFAVLASVQGTTHETTIERRVQWEVGADIQFKLSTPSIGSIIESSVLPSISESTSDLDKIITLGKLAGEILNDPLNVYFTDLNEYKDLKFFQNLNDGFIGASVEDAIANTLNDDLNNALVGKNVLSQSKLNVGDTINLNIFMSYWNGTGWTFDRVVKKITISGILSHGPGGVSGNDVLVNYKFIQKLMNSDSMKDAFSAYNGNIDPDLILASLGVTISDNEYNSYYPGDIILAETSKDPEELRKKIISEIGPLNDFLADSYTYGTKLNAARDLTSTGFGIAGLLTSMFIISLVCATIGTFIFISLLVNSRSKEFAILRAIGATEGQIYKITLSEVISVLIFSLLAGIVLGLGLSYLFNGFFEFMAQFSDPGLLSYFLPRVIIVPWESILISMIFTALVIVIATVLPTRSVATKEIIEETRQI